MELTEQRTAQLINYLDADKDRANRLFVMPVEDVLTQINADGNDFVLEELVEFGQQVQKALTNVGNQDELNEESLEEISGGALPLAVVGWAISAFGAGYKIGADLARNYGW